MGLVLPGVTCLLMSAALSSSMVKLSIFSKVRGPCMILSLSDPVISGSFGTGSTLSLLVPLLLCDAMATLDDDRLPP